MLTSKQEQLLGIAKKKGFITLSDAYVVYNSQLHRINALRLLVKMGFLKLGTQANRFDLVKK